MIPRGVMVKAMDYGIVGNKFELRSLYYVYFRATTFVEKYVPPYPPRPGLNSTTIVLLGEWLWHWITYKDWYAIPQRNQIKPCMIHRELFFFLFSHKKFLEIHSFIFPGKLSSSERNYSCSITYFFKFLLG